ncbi:acid-sensing ion channel 1A-like [Argopecten irradians]|uniref:acid-sensing ion channel 1A-like n=1 Tax=Argopecten irradians TaxID=31199 RepID=UPI0037196476
MKKIKVKPAVNNIMRKMSSQKKPPRKTPSPLGDPPVYSVTEPLPPPEATVVPLEYRTDIMMAVPAKPPLQEKTSQESPYLPDTNVQGLWQTFRSNTTMHGLKYASDIHKYKLRGVIWIVALLCMGGLLIYTCVDLFNKYIEHSTISNIKVELVNELSFPSITFCNLSPYKRSALKPDGVMDHYLLTLSRMKDFVPEIDYDHPYYSNLSNPIPDGWIYNVSSTVYDFFGACVDMKDVVQECEDVLVPKLTDMGLCFTFNSREYIKKNGSLITTSTGSTKSLAFYIMVNQGEYVYSDNMGAGMKIVVHDPDEEPDTEKGFFASPGFSSYASLELTKYKYMPYPHKSMGGGYCLDTKDASFKHELIYHETYSRKACLRECKYKFLISKCGCQAPTDFGSERTCTMREHAECYYVYSAQYANNMTLQNDCQCKTPCEFNTYGASVTTAYFPSVPNDWFFQQMGFQDMRSNFMEVRIFFDTLSYLNVEYQAEYDLEKIVATLGGQMGIFLGASLLTLSELVEFLVMAALVCCKRFTRRRR